MRVRITRRGIAYGLFCLAAGGALSAAGAAVIFNGSINGTTANAATPSVWYINSSSPTGSGDGSGVTCTPTYNSLTSLPTPPPGNFANNLGLAIADAFPGSVCTFTVDVQASGGGTVLQDITLNVAGSGGSIGYTASLGSNCGLPIAGPGSASGTTVTFTVTAPTGSGWTAGETGTITGDLQAVPAAQYSSSACT